MSWMTEGIWFAGTDSIWPLKEHERSAHLHVSVMCEVCGLVFGVCSYIHVHWTVNLCLMDYYVQHSKLCVCVCGGVKTDLRRISPLLTAFMLLPLLITHHQSLL